LLAESLGDWLDAVAKYRLGVDLVDVMIQVGVLHRFAIILLVGRAGGELGSIDFDALNLDAMIVLGLNDTPNRLSRLGGVPAEP
jgi:hypothetical protein